MTVTQVPADPRAEYIKGLRALADALQASPEDLPLPYEGNATRMTMHFLAGEDPRAAMAAAARALPGALRKRVREYDDGSAYFHLEGELHGLKVELVAFRDAVCERVVTGTKTITEKVKDPGALAKVPEIEVTREVEEVEWVCAPVLAPVTRDGAEAGDPLALPPRTEAERIIADAGTGTEAA